MAVLVCLPTSSVRGFPFLHALSSIYCCRLLDSSHPDWPVMVPRCGFDLRGSFLKDHRQTPCSSCLEAEFLGGGAQIQVFLKSLQMFRKRNWGVRSLVGACHSTEGTGLPAERPPSRVLGSHPEPEVQAPGQAHLSHSCSWHFRLGCNFRTCFPK